MTSFNLNTYKGFLETPPLWLNKQFGIQQFKMPAIDALTIRRQPIPENLRLGHKMELVFQQCLASQDQYRYLHSNVKIKKDKITLGEIDFLLENTHTRQVVHVELTYKFYIIDTDITEPIYQLIGPNKRDRFYSKIEKIKHRQLPLVFSNEGIATLQKLGIESSAITQEVCYKAQLFIPYGKSTVTMPPFNQECVIGYWIRFETFSTANFKKHNYYIPTKAEWILHPYKSVRWITHGEVLLEITSRINEENAPMVWVHKTDGTMDKFFVVWW